MNPEIFRHLDQGSSQALLAEAQGSGVIGNPEHNTFTHHIDDVLRELESANKTIGKIDVVLGDRKIKIKAALREQLRHLAKQLKVRVDTVQSAVNAAKSLNRNYGSRLTGIELPSGRLVTDSLSLHGQKTGQALSLLPDDPQFAGVLEEINKLPVRPGQKAAPTGSLIRKAQAIEAPIQGKPVAVSNPVIEPPVTIVSESVVEPPAVTSTKSEPPTLERPNFKPSFASRAQRVLQPFTPVFVYLQVTQESPHYWESKYDTEDAELEYFFLSFLSLFGREKPQKPPHLETNFAGGSH